MIKVNLLPREILEKEKGKKAGMLIGLIGFVIVLIVACIFGLRVLKLNILNVELKAIENKLIPLQSVIQQVDTIETEKAKLNTKIGVIKTLMQDSLVYPHLMEDISGLIPNNVWLNSLETRTLEQKLSVTMKLSSANNHGVALFVALLESSDKFEKVKMGAISTSKKDDVEIRDFQINCEYINKWE